LKYPRVLSEDETIDRAASWSMARFGDGELRLAVGANSISQRETSPQLVAELKAMLLAPPQNCMVCIPNVYSATPKADSWARYGDSKFVSLYGDTTFGSSFITRPDSAPWIDRPDYWDKVEQLWRSRDVVLVRGRHDDDGRPDLRSLRPDMIASAASVRIVEGPYKNAYAQIDRIERDVLALVSEKAASVLICLGAAATVLAARLATKGVHALDLGHIGMFMRHAGAYRYQLGQLVSPGYRATLNAMHDRQRWGADGHKHADAVRALVQKVEAATILDYGCGRGTLAASMAPIRVSGYDPGIPGKEGMPKPCDLVVCTDVLEHVEEDRLDAVLDHLKTLAGKALYLVIATREANATLPDGRNAHLLVRSAQWWTDKLATLNFASMTFDARSEREIKVTLCH
jgi:2-polyprenyl-3-methyl-5-hydroxy-6-metoxy-1,4-benzoquinol methylase